MLYASWDDEDVAFLQVNVAIVHLEGENAVLDTYLMSCRVIGRGIEHKLMQHIIEDLKAQGVTRVLAHFVETSKNTPAKEFLSSAGYALVQRDGDRMAYALDVAAHRGLKAFVPIDTIILEKVERFV